MIRSGRTSRSDRRRRIGTSVAARAGAPAALVTLLLTGCAGNSDEAVATWKLAGDQAITASATTLSVLVTRLGCNSGVTGDVNEPDVELTDEAVVLTFTVSPGEEGDADCQGNPPVRYEVELPEPLGDRALVDGQCASEEASSTAPCRPDGVRYSP